LRLAGDEALDARSDLEPHHDDELGALRSHQPRVTDSVGALVQSRTFPAARIKWYCLGSLPVRFASSRTDTAIVAYLGKPLPLYFCAGVSSEASCGLAASLKENSTCLEA
jgi:hypothetical protein